VRRAKSRRLKGEGGEDEDDLDDDSPGDDEAETVDEPDLKH